jgi:hypothetical protein
MDETSRLVEGNRSGIRGVDAELEVAKVRKCPRMGNDGAEQGLTDATPAECRSNIHPANSGVVGPLLGVRAGQCRDADESPIGERAEYTGRGLRAEARGDVRERPAGLGLVAGTKRRRNLLESFETEWLISSRIVRGELSNLHSTGGRLHTRRPARKLTAPPGAIKLGIDVHQDFHIVVMQKDRATPKPCQRFAPQASLHWAAGLRQQGHSVYAVHEACGFGFGLCRELEKFAVRQRARARMGV